jgi:hypothetical protein
MSIELVTGKLYNLRFSDDEADVESFIDGIAKICGDYKLIGVGMIPSKEGTKFEYYLFKNCNTDEIVEVFKGSNEYNTLVFYKRDVVTLGAYSDYLEYGWDEFPEFAGPHCDSVLNVTIREVVEE